jgi:ubiquinone/menaquinone biosynthesis C-methylase UbiE
MQCKYCDLIHAKDPTYPLREASFDVAGDFPRCEWHWRYRCDVCGQPRHFNGITWCDQSATFICLSCGRGNQLVDGPFWQWQNYYAVRCPQCHDRHPTLDRLEYEGRHPWQLHPHWQQEKRGLSPEHAVTVAYSSHHYLTTDRGVSDRMVGAAWNRFADEWATRYTEAGDLNRQYIIDPALFHVLGRVQGQRILDAGCGNGYLCRLLATRGATVTGVDVSKRFIELAEQQETQRPLHIEYQVGSLCHLTMFPDDTFDAIVSNIVLSDLQNLQDALHELHRVLKPGGTLVFSIMHPCFSSPPIKGWVKKPVDSNRREDWLYWQVDRYFDRSVEEWRFYDAAPIYGFHRPLSDYLTQLLQNGFTITAFEEPVPTQQAIDKHYRELNDANRIPWFLVIGAQKAREWTPDR